MTLFGERSPQGDNPFLKLLNNQVNRLIAGFTFSFSSQGVL